MDRLSTNNGLQKPERLYSLGGGDFYFTLKSEKQTINMNFDAIDFDLRVCDTFWDTFGEKKRDIKIKTE